jgi:HEAT repeat protein
MAEGESAPQRLGNLAVHVPWESTIDPAAERKAVEDRLEGLTAPMLMTHVRAVAALGDKAPDQLKFFNRATGFLKLHPEAAAAFVDLIHEPKMSYQGRAFALDILASAGNDVVQAALVKILRDPRTRALPEYFSLYQRLALVRAPSDATVRFGEETFDRLHDHASKDEAEADLRTASVYTLGSVAGHMKDTRRLEGAERICRRLVDKMNVDEAKRSHANAYITALGNAAVPAQEPFLLRLSEDPDQETRVAAINALRKYDTAASRGRVVGLLTSPVGATANVDFPTQAEALRAFMLMTPGRADIVRVADAIVKDTLHRDLYGDTIPLFRKGKASLADVSAALDAMFERSKEHDNDLQTRIDTLRAELSSQP